MISERNLGAFEDCGGFEKYDGIEYSKRNCDMLRTWLDLQTYILITVCLVGMKYCLSLWDQSLGKNTDYRRALLQFSLDD